MLVTTAMVGVRRRNEPSLSSASATSRSPRPSLALLSITPRRPPMMIVGSSPAPARTCATIEVVVVLPCDPAMAMPYLMRMSSASISARGITGIWRRRASSTSGLSGRTAEETTTTSASPTPSAKWPRATVAPMARSRCTVALSSRSEPVTWYPRLTRTSAMPLMPMPPIPTKWRRRVLRSITMRASRGDLLDHVHDARRGVRARQRGRGALHRDHAPRVSAQGQEGPRQTLAGQHALLHHDRGARLRELARVVALVIVGRRRQGHQDRGLAARGDLRHAAGAGARDHQVGPLVGFADVEDVREHGRLEAGRRVRRTGALAIVRAGAVREAQPQPVLLEVGKGVEDGVVDRLRSLAAAKNQDIERVAARLALRRPERGPDRIAGHLAAASKVMLRLLERHRHPTHPGRQDPVGQSREVVLLVNQARPPQGHGR